MKIKESYFWPRNFRSFSPFVFFLSVSLSFSLTHSHTRERVLRLSLFLSSRLICHVFENQRFHGDWHLVARLLRGLPNSLWPVFLFVEKSRLATRLPVAPWPLRGRIVCPFTLFSTSLLKSFVEGMSCSLLSSRRWADRLQQADYKRP